MTDLEQAKDLLASGEITVAIVRGGEAHTDTRRGVMPLLALLDGKADVRGASAADRVVGRGAAFLYVLLGVSAVYAPVMSEGAMQLLLSCGISAAADAVVPAIRNRAGDGFCPMETAVSGITDPAEALAAIRRKLAELGK